jgi:hypothetical protein
MREKMIQDVSADAFNFSGVEIGIPGSKRGEAAMAVSGKQLFIDTGKPIPVIFPPTILPGMFIGMDMTWTITFKDDGIAMTSGDKNMAIKWDSNDNRLELYHEINGDEFKINMGKNDWKIFKRVVS